MIAGPAGMPVFLSLRLDVRVQVFTAAIAVLATLVCGLLPAIQSTGVDLLRGLRDPHSAPDRRRARGRAALVALQVAVSVVLMVGALLLFRSVRNSTVIDLGFDPDHVAVVSFDLQANGHDAARASAFYSELQIDGDSGRAGPPTMAVPSREWTRPGVI